MQRMSQAWIPKTLDEACKRAAGRRRYHAERRRARDKRQLLIIKVLLERNWKSYGIGRKLAKTLSVDPATISRDIKYIRSWLRSFKEIHKLSERFANAVIGGMVAAGIHPRLGYSWTYTFTNDGRRSLTVRRAGRTPVSFCRQCGKPWLGGDQAL